MGPGYEFAAPNDQVHCSSPSDFLSTMCRPPGHWNESVLSPGHFGEHEWQDDDQLPDLVFPECSDDEDQVDCPDRPPGRMHEGRPPGNLRASGTWSGSIENMNALSGEYPQQFSLRVSRTRTMYLESPWRKISKNTPKQCKRFASPDIWKLASVNITSWKAAPLVMALEKYVASTFQELCRDLSSKDYMTKGANSAGYHANIHPSVITPAGGKSAGVAVVAKWQYPIADLTLPDLISMPVKERFVFSIWHGPIPNGIGVASVYNVSGAGVGQENLDNLELIGGFLRAWGRPFIISGDWQMSPQQLQEECEKFSETYFSIFNVGCTRPTFTINARKNILPQKTTRKQQADINRP